MRYLPLALAGLAMLAAAATAQTPPASNPQPGVTQMPGTMTAPPTNPTTTTDDQQPGSNPGSGTMPSPSPSPSPSPTATAMPMPNDSSMSSPSDSPSPMATPAKHSRHKKMKKPR